jgi:hypothetical protein
MSPGERVEGAVSVVMRLGVSALLPAWAVIMIVLGVKYGSPWWLATGIVVGAIGVLFLAGSPLADLIMRER